MSRFEKQKLVLHSYFLQLKWYTRVILNFTTYRHTFCLTSATWVRSYEFSSGARTARRLRNSPFCFLKSRPRIELYMAKYFEQYQCINSRGFLASFPALQSCVCSRPTNFHDLLRFGTWLRSCDMKFVLKHYRHCVNIKKAWQTYCQCTPKNTRVFSN